MSSKEKAYPFEQETKEPEQAFGEVALDGVPVEIDDQSTGEYSVPVSANNQDADPFADLGYTQDNHAGEFESREQT